MSEQVPDEVPDETFGEIGFPIDEGAELHSVPFSPPIQAFHPGSSLREAFAQWWTPDIETSEQRKQRDEWMRGEREAGRPIVLHSEDLVSSSTFLWRLLFEQEIRTEGHDYLLRARTAAGEPQAKCMKTCLRIAYPLVQPVEREFTVRLSRIGEVFGFGFDLYREVYDADDALRQGAPAPRVSEQCGNRQASALVWGHDFSDLVYEGLLHFPPNPGELAAGSLGRFEFVVGS